MKNVPNKVILHCAVTPDYPDHSAKYDLFGAEDINEWHKKRKFSGIGYHYVIRRTGRIQAGRHPSVVGAHVQGHNQDSLGICLIGTKLFTVPQWQSLCELYLQIKSEYMIAWQNWFGHYEFTDAKTCPNVDMHLVRGALSLYERSAVDCECSAQINPGKVQIDPMDLS